MIKEFKTIVLAALGLCPCIAAAADLLGSPQPTIDKTWFTPELETNSDPICESIHTDALRVFKSGDDWDVAYGDNQSHFRALKRLPRPYEGRLEPSPTMEFIEGRPPQFKVTEPNGSAVYLLFRENTGCGGACNTTTVLASAKPFPGTQTRDSEAETVYTSTPGSHTWSAYQSMEGHHYVIGVVKGHLQVYLLTARNLLTVACDVKIEPDDLRSNPDAAIQAGLATIDGFWNAIRALSRGAGSCGSMRTAGRWATEQRQELYQALYRPWGVRPWAEKRKIRSDNSFGDYSRIREQLKTWSRGGVLEHQAYVAYEKEFRRATNDLAQFYVAKFGWTAPQAGEQAERTLSAVVANGMGFYMYEPYSGPAEENLRIALLENLSLSAVRAVPLEGIPLSKVLDSAVLHPDALRYLLEKGADPNWTNDFGKTALMYAAQYNQLESARILIAHGADPNAATVRPPDDCYYTISTTGMTPLHYATRYASASLTTLLLDNGAVTFSRSSRGYPLDWLHQYGNSTAIERNSNLTDSDVAALSERLKLPEQLTLQTLSEELTRRAERHYSAGRLEQAYQAISVALRADPNNNAALADYQLIAIKTRRRGEALQAGRILLDRDLSERMRANVWFNNGLACEDQVRLSFNGAYYCSGDPFRPFLKSWLLAPTAARAAKLRDLFMSVKKSTCVVKGAAGLEHYQFEFSSIHDDGRHGYVQRIYAFHARSSPIDSRTLQWSVRMATPEGPVVQQVSPSLISRYELGDFAVTVFEADYRAQGAVTIQDQTCHPYY